MIYYNENDPKAAAWLVELISRDLIAPGVVDTRSTVDVYVSDFSTVQIVPESGGLSEDALRRALEECWRNGGTPDQIYYVDFDSVEVSRWASHKFTGN